MDPLVHHRPGLAAAIVAGDDATLDRLERLITIHRARGQTTERRAETAFKKMWPGW